MDIKNQIKQEIISKKQDIRLDFFINKILFEKNSYYSSKIPIGKSNDFITSPEISQFFGEIIALYIVNEWNTKIKSKFNLIELGPGKGTLIKDILRTVTSFQGFLEKANIKLIDINKELINNQKNALKDFRGNKIEWDKTLNIKSKYPLIIYSNEFFDCFPVRHFQLKNFWSERFVSYNKNDDYFYFKYKKINNKKILSLLNNQYLKEGIAEVSLERNRYFDKICKLIKKNKGIFITIDYGYFENISNFTLQAIHKHKYANILENLGNQDISSHVDFKSFINIAKSHDLKIDEFCSQRDFLIKYGILERMNNVSKLMNNIDQESIKLEVKKLTNKKEMGELFKFLIVSYL